MGPTNVALVKLYLADAALRQAIERHENAARSVRLIERRIADLTEKYTLAHSQLREQQAKAANLELDIKSRDAHIEKLRVAQQIARNNKEYQALLSEINTGKIDKGKVEDESIKAMEQVEKLSAEEKSLSAQLQEEKTRLEATQQSLGGKLAELQKEIDELRPIRDAAATAVPPRGREAFDRLAERHEGEALSALAKPNPRYEEYICTACNMSLVTDVYNRLHARDELIFCPSCHRMLYIPDDLPPEAAVHSGATKGARKPAATGERKKRAPSIKTASKKKASASAPAGPDETPSKPAAPASPWSDLLWAAQGESLTYAHEAQQPPVDCEVSIDGKTEGVFRGKSADNLERVIRFRMDEAGRKGTVMVTQHRLAQPPEPSEGIESSPPPQSAAQTATPGEASPADEDAGGHSPLASPDAPGADRAGDPILSDSNPDQPQHVAHGEPQNA